MTLVSQNKLETNKTELTISVDAQAFEEAIQKAYKKNVGKINVPGFRKGKAPRKMIEKLYGEGVFFEDAINALYPSAMQDAIKEAGLEVVAAPEVEVTEVAADKGFTFKAVCITKPEVEVSDYKGLKAEKVVKTVTDEEVNGEIDRLRNRNSRMVEVSDRAAQKGDTVVFDFEGFVDGEAFEGGKAEQFSLELGSGQFIPGFEDQMENKQIGEDFEVNVTFPEDYHAENLKGKAAVFKCKISAIKVKELPEADDEFAKDVSEFETLAEFKEALKKQQQEANERAAEQDVENQLIDGVIANMKAEIPEVMYEASIDNFVNEFEYRLSTQGMDIKTYLQYVGMEMDSFRKTFREQAEKQVKIRLALEKIVELENIAVTDEEIEAKYAEFAENYKMEAEQIKNFIRKEDLTKDIAVNKAIDLIKSSAEVKEVAEKTEKKSTAKKTTTKKTTKKADDSAEKTEKKTTRKSTAKKAEETKE